jgi:hypothetical protein
MSKILFEVERATEERRSFIMSSITLSESFILIISLMSRFAAALDAPEIRKLSFMQLCNRNTQTYQDLPL